MTSLESLRSIVLLYGSSITAAEILNHFASRQRNRHMESVSRLNRFAVVELSAEL